MTEISVSWAPRDLTDSLWREHDNRAVNTRVGGRGKKHLPRTLRKYPFKIWPQGPEHPHTDKHGRVLANSPEKAIRCFVERVAEHTQGGISPEGQNVLQAAIMDACRLDWYSGFSYLHLEPHVPAYLLTRMRVWNGWAAICWDVLEENIDTLDLLREHFWGAVQGIWELRKKHLITAEGGLVSSWPWWPGEDDDEED